MRLRRFVNKFQTRVTFAFVFSLLLVTGTGSYFLYRYSLNLHFNQLKDKLLVIATTASLMIDADSLLKVPLNKEGVASQEYKAIAAKLRKIKELNPSLKYIYTVTKTSQPGIWQFIVDPNPVSPKANINGPTAFPGDKYDASRFPELMNAYYGPQVENKLVVDEWGLTLSGYAPIYNKENMPAAVLGVDMNVDSIYAMENRIRIGTFIILALGVLISIILGVVISKGVTDPVEKLVEGTRRFGSGDLKFQVKVRGSGEIAELASSLNQMAFNLADSRQKLHDYFYRVVQAMIRSLEAKDHYTRGHSDRVSEYSEKIALAMGIPQDKVEELTKAAQLHDIGKLGIHEDILNKKGPLSESEWDLLHQHPVVGEEILQPVFLDDEMLSVIRSHHERYDGTGYPDRLKGDQINLFAQIVAVADAYDAMTTSRSYRPALNKEESILRLKSCSGTQFNPKIVDIFVTVLGQSV